jgi:hypothetical protein
MNSVQPKKPSRGALVLIEEAVHLLRQSPPTILVPYFLGSMPFILGLLYFWSEMTASAVARRHCSEAALAMALLFAWMKVFQAVFMRLIWAAASGGEAKWLGIAAEFKIAISQIFVQSVGMVAIPIAALIALPFGWVYAFFQNALVEGGKGETDVMPAVQRARKQTELWPKENHFILLILFAFGLFVFINIGSGAILLPFLLKTLLGIETVFSQSIFAMFNSTFFAAILGLTYLCVDPIIKTVYVLRCFYGESLQTGADIHVELTRLVVAARIIIIALLTGICLFTVPSARAEDATRPADLDRSISEVIERPKFAWRMPREKAADEEPGLLESFFDSVSKTMGRWMKVLGKYIKAFFEWLIDKLFPQGSSDGQGPSSGWATAQRGLMYILLTAAAVVLGILCWRLYRRRGKKVQPVVAAVAVKVDLTDENVVADQLPEDEWLKLSREMFQKGELRLALRAIYLAGLARLAARNMIVIAKFKSNREYEAELRRRAHVLPELPLVFGENVTVFEKVWYGKHEATADAINQLTSNFEKLKSSSPVIAAAAQR